MTTPALLVLADGSVFHGTSIGYEGSTGYGLVDRAGELFAGALAGFVREGGRFAECERQGAQAVAQGCCVLGADLRPNYFPVQ